MSERAKNPSGPSGDEAGQPPHEIDRWLLAGVETHYLGRPSFLKDFDPLALGTAELAGAGGCLVFLAGRSDGGLPVEGATGLDTVAERAALLNAARSLVRSAMSAGAVRRAEAATTEEGYALPPIYVEPIVARGQSLGALVVFGAWHDDVAPRMARAARLAAHLVTERLLHQEVDDLKRRLGAAEREKARLGPQAELGAATRDVAAASLRALADVLAFGRRVARELPAGDLNREYMEALVAEVERLDRLWTEQRELATLGARHLTLEDLSEIVHDVEASFGDEIGRRRARVIRRLTNGLPPLLLDVAQVRRVLSEIVAGLLETLPNGGRLKLETRRGGDQVQVLLGADGPRRPGDSLDRLFLAFTPAGHPADGPITGLVRQVIREHGGEIGVRADVDWPALYVLSFPIRNNQDRRRPATDRRIGRDRRAA
jgi:signal transduction histidine kinase